MGIRLKSNKKIDVRRDFLLKNLNTFKIGGRASYFFIAHSIDELQRIIKKEKDFYFLGGGSNLLISDSSIDKPIVTLGEEFSFIERQDNTTLIVGAMTPLSKLISYAIGKSLKGLEELVGIPATIGGMTVMNASAFGKEFSSLVEEVVVFTKEGEIKHIGKDEIKFGYHYSSLKEYIIIKVKIKLQEAAGIKDSIGLYLRQRLAYQDFMFPSAGCIFKNPPYVSVGLLIERCFLKGFRVGDAQISLKHANFIINRGKAKTKDVIYLISVIKERVYDRFGIYLEEEVVRWGC